MTNRSANYRDAALCNFTALMCLYAKNDKLSTDIQASFWKLGNAFDTMIDFLEIIDASTANDVAEIAVTQLYASLGKITGGFDGAWFDDFGWWSVATQRAQEKPFFDSAAKDQLKGVLSECWPRFTDNAPFVWERRGTTNTFNDYGPFVNGGVWNAYWAGTPAQYPGPKDGNPSDGHLIGIQNTVTNALYLMAAHRLGRTDSAAAADAVREHTFMFTWFDVPEEPLWWQINPETALVRERVAYFANMKRAPSGDCYGFQNDWAWAGDQGLILGYLCDAINDSQYPDQRKSFLARAENLLVGAGTQLADKTTSVLQSYTQTGCVPDGDRDDYQVGSGVFWRNALYAYKTTSDLRGVLAAPFFQGMLAASADAASKPLTGNESFETLTNQTAVLVAATAMGL